MSLVPKLAVVMPVFNEQASIRKVVREWFEEIQNWTEDFVFIVLDDGSLDATRALLARLEQELGPRLLVHSQANQGHGQTCLQGYRQALKLGAPWVLQIDSDGQCDPQYFFRFWNQRGKYDVILGNRARRDDGWQRVMASHVLRLTILLFAKTICRDANVPYRLMSAASLQRWVEKVPSGFFLSNVALAILMKRDSSLRHGFVPICFRERYGGEPSVPFRTFGYRALELIRSLRYLD